MLATSKTLAAAFLDLLLQPALLSQVRMEWKRKTQGKPSQSPLPVD
jgi:aminobenzoyl-glutamate utilization protein B